MLKKYIVLAILFILPVAIYVFFASGIYHFQTLPIMVKNVPDVYKFYQSKKKITLSKKITVLGFLGDNLDDKTLLFNLNQKVYKRFYEFNDFQFVMVLPEGSENKISNLMKELSGQTGTDTSKWNFIFGNKIQITNLFNSLKTPYSLKNLSSNMVFIVDKKRQLRGRDTEKVFGYDALSVAEISNVMIDDIKVLLAEYRLELKKNGKSRRQKYLKFQTND